MNKVKKKGRILLIFTIASIIVLSIAYYFIESKPKETPVQREMDEYPQNATLV
ncbi:MAG: hypothetical protein LBH84_02105 [Prevotellaceae bacterium]|jgi:hypothetical protein|nr:hypothetical protein [Prevotellaceae bacterium]